MKLRLLAVALPLLLALPLSGPAVAEDPVPSAKDYPAPPAGWKVPRTAWGDPDLRGMWPVDYLAATPRERPPEIGTRTEWTEQEYKERFGQAEQRAGLEAAQDKIGILGMGHWRLSRLFARTLGRRHPRHRDDQLHARYQQRPLA